jgi:hypothetical protein
MPSRTHVQSACRRYFYPGKIHPVTLQNFEYNLPDTQLAKGRSYYKDGQVIMLEEWQPGQWQATVSGSEDYDVNIVLADGDIIEVACDCPHDADYCKHAIAVLYAIREECGASAILLQKKQPKSSAAKDFAAALAAVPEADLREFILAYAKKESAFRTMFFAHFAGTAGGEKKEDYAAIIRNAFKSAGGRNGFIEYHDVPRFMKPVQTLLAKADAAFGTKQYATVFAIAAAVVEVMTELINDIDDSRGTAGDCIHHGFQLLGQLVQAGDVPRDLKEKLFAYTLGEASGHKYNGFDFNEAWLDLLLSAELDNTKAAEVMQLLDKKLADASAKSGTWHSDYERSSLLQKKIGLLLQTGRRTEAEALRLQHIDLPAVRKEIIEELIQKRDYEPAKTLIREGIALASSQRLPGIVLQFMQLLLRVAQLQNDVPALRKIAAELYEESNFAISYYRILKASYSPAEWPDVAEGIIARLQDYKGLFGIAWSSGNAALAAVYVEEQYRGRLMSLMEATPALDFLERYHHYLLPHYPERVLAAYSTALTKYAADHADRSHYAVIRDMLLRMLDWPGGRDVVNALLKNFKERYRQRRAMMDELGKVG